MNHEDRVKIDEKKDFPLIQSIKANQNSNMYFFRRKKNTQVKKDAATVIDKEIVKEYEGVFFRSYSYLDLLNLVHM